MPLPEVLANSFFQLIERPLLRNAIGKESFMHLHGGELAGSANDDPIVDFFAFEYGAWTDPQLLPDFGGHGNLPLRGDL